MTYYFLFPDQIVYMTVYHLTINMSSNADLSYIWIKHLFHGISGKDKEMVEIYVRDLLFIDID